MIELDRIYNEDCLTTLSKIQDNSIDLVVTSPPYNKGYYSKIPQNAIWGGAGIDYDSYNDCVEPNKYEETQRQVLKELLRVIKPTGSIFYNHKDIINDGHIVHPKFVYDFPVHQVLVWNRTNSPMISTRYFLPVTEYFFWIVKDSKQFFFDRAKSSFTTNVIKCVADRNNDHPAPFPLSIVTSIIDSCSNRGGGSLRPLLW